MHRLTPAPFCCFLLLTRPVRCRIPNDDGNADSVRQNCRSKLTGIRFLSHPDADSSTTMESLPAVDQPLTRILNNGVGVACRNWLIFSRSTQLPLSSCSVAESSTMAMMVVWPLSGLCPRISAQNVCRTDLGPVLSALDEATCNNDGGESV